MMHRGGHTYARAQCSCSELDDPPMRAPDFAVGEWARRTAPLGEEDDSAGWLSFEFRRVFDSTIYQYHL